MNNLLENLNKEQLQAVLHKDGPLLIVAGAGTGKTTVITQRIAYLIEQGLARSDEILALTFTEKAAGEMEERVDQLLPIGYLDLWISTFHSFGERILKEHGLEIGLPADFKVLNEFEQWALIQKNLDKFNLNYYRPLGSPTKFIHALVKHFARAKDEDISPSDYLKYAEELKENLDGMLGGGKQKTKMSLRGAQSSASLRRASDVAIPGQADVAQDRHGLRPRDDNMEITQQEAARINELANSYHVYQQLLLDSNALDFGDLINYCLKLFRERPQILAKYREQFKYILLDEFQDTNWAQYELIKILAAPKNNLVVVGDDDQSIYKFRGASVANILQFKKDFPKTKEIVLTKNYRNRQNILDSAYNFIQLNNPNRLEWQLNKSQILSLREISRRETNPKSPKINKKLSAENKGQGIIEIIRGEDLQAELQQAVEIIASLKIEDKECSWNDFGILVRANESAKEICNLLDLAGLPYQYLASRGLYSKPVIMDIIAYLKLLDNYHESPALYRILNLPIFNFHYQELVMFNYYAKKKAWSLYEVLTNGSILNFGSELQAKVDYFLKLLAKHTALVREKSVVEILLAFMQESGYLKYLINQDERLSREATSYLNQFMKRVQAFASGSDDKSVKAFLAELNLEIESGEQGALGFDYEAGPEAIKVMTVHGAKGLEFKYVFITNLVDKRFPTIERSDRIPIPDQLVKEILPEGDIHLQEERRLFYVAMTRAKLGLFFSWAPDYGGMREKKPSRFLYEIGLLDDKRGGVILSETKDLGRARTKPTSQPTRDSSSRRLAGLRMTEKNFKKTEEMKFYPPPYFSYSQLAAFTNCPYQYRFAHVLKIPTVGKVQFSFGKTMHAALQRLFSLANEKKGLGQTELFGEKSVETRHGASLQNSAPKISTDELKIIFERSWIDDWYESKKQKEEFKKLGLKILVDFVTKHKSSWPNNLYLEKNFSFKIKASTGVYSVKGAIDRIDKTDTGLKIIDYKTGGPKTKFSFEDKEQLLIYQLAMCDLFKEPVSAVAFYYLEDNSEVEFLGTDSELKKVEAKIIATIGEISKGEFPPKPSALCKYCDFFTICEFRKA